MKNSRNARNWFISDFYCTKCGNKNFPIIRTTGKVRESGHLKKLFCIYCQKEVNMVEVRPRGKYSLDDFWVEFNYHNFDENGNRIEPYRQFVSKVREGADIK